MIYKNALLHNVAELVQSGSGEESRIQRVPEAVRSQLEEPARARTLNPDGCEIRFVLQGPEAEITVSAPLLKRYRERLAAFTGGLRDFCARREITLLTLSSDTPIDDLLLGYLRERGVLR